MADVNDGRVFEDKSLGTTVSFTLQNSLSLSFVRGIERTTRDRRRNSMHIHRSRIRATSRAEAIQLLKVCERKNFVCEKQQDGMRAHDIHNFVSL